MYTTMYLDEDSPNNRDLLSRLNTQEDRYNGSVRISGIDYCWNENSWHYGADRYLLEPPMALRDQGLIFSLVVIEDRVGAWHPLAEGTYKLADAGAEAVGVVYADYTLRGAYAVRVESTATSYHESCEIAHILANRLYTKIRQQTIKPVEPWLVQGVDYVHDPYAVGPGAFVRTVRWEPKPEVPTGADDSTPPPPTSDPSTTAAEEKPANED